MEESGFGDAAETLPARTRTPNFYVVLYNADGTLCAEECASKGEATSFVNHIGHSNVQVVYKASERITPKVSASL